MERAYIYCNRRQVSVTRKLGSHADAMTSVSALTRLFEMQDFAGIMFQFFFRRTIRFHNKNVRNKKVLQSKRDFHSNRTNLPLPPLFGKTVGYKRDADIEPIALQEGKSFINRSTQFW
jgi:hypothetical protein